mmetsp:Transcript_8283/g.28164  ORF Transcript_8283/g.28164 Transcript_8283/m.28164 type:complete len:178 (-) Transcript_8283:858-1391(-)
MVVSVYAAFLAAEVGDLEVLRECVESRRHTMRDRDSGFTLLHLAAGAGHEEACRLLLADGRLNVDERDMEGRTALHHACAACQVQCVDLLIAHHADYFSRDLYGEQPFGYLTTVPRRFYPQRREEASWNADGALDEPDPFPVHPQVPRMGMASLVMGEAPAADEAPAKPEEAALIAL